MDRKLPEKPLTASEALTLRIERWTNVSTTERDDHNERSLNSTCAIIGSKIMDRLQTSLMSQTFPASWLDPILDFIESSAKQLFQTGGNADDFNGNLIAEVAALRFESLEFEARMDAQAKSQQKLERRLAAVERRVA